MYTYLSLIVIILALSQISSVSGANLIITGDTKVLSNTTAHFQYTVEGSYPAAVYFQYEIRLELPTGTVDQVVYSKKVATWKHNFKNIPAGSYEMNVKVYFCIFSIRDWQIAEKTITVEVKDDIGDFFHIVGHQDDLIGQGPNNNVFRSNKTVNFTAEMISENSVLKNAEIDYKWSIQGPANLSELDQNVTVYTQNLTVIGMYKIVLEITANLTEYGIIMNGTITKEIRIKDAVVNVNINGNTFVENGSMFRLNVTWDGTSAFIFCHYFSPNKSDKACFDSGIVLDRTNYSFSRYFGVNGTMFVNIGVRNDVSEVMKTVKITIYKVGPKQSIVFIILPLFSLLAVIIMIALGIGHHIKRRANLNSTIETATIENFGLNRSDGSMEEISFFKRIKDTVVDMFPKRRDPSDDTEQLVDT